LRLLQTVVDVSAEKNSTLVMPFPVEILRFFERLGNGQLGGGPESDGERTDGARPDGERTDQRTDGARTGSSRSDGELPSGQDAASKALNADASVRQSAVPPPDQSSATRFSPSRAVDHSESA
jgi:hypothetical protein